MNDLRTAAQQALEALEEYQSKGAPFLACDGAVDALRAALAQQAEPLNLRDPAVQKRLATQWGYAPAAQAEPDLSRCPQCNGPADNGFDRSIPPSPYLCTKCMAEPVAPVAWRDEVHRLHAENASLAAALASSCDEQRHELWESGGIAGCERARVAERQRDALLEALKWLDRWMGDKTMPECRWKVRGTIEAVEGENHAKSL